ncbi:MAG: putative addiction module antidote protein, partial [Acidobacteria bacterium]
MPKRSKDYVQGLVEDLKDPIEAMNYLNAALEESQEVFLLALRDVAAANRMARVAEEAGLSREALY